jgi:hypothetical protein
VDKIITYEQILPKSPDWLNKVLLIASYESWIKHNAERLGEEIHEYNSDLEILRSYAEYETLHEDTCAQDIVNYFNEGIGLVVFAGHGGGYVWEAGPSRLKGKNMFDLDHVESLKNKNKYPIVVGATCYTGAFDMAGDKQSIGMKLVNKRKGGAIAVLGTPHRSNLYHDIVFARTFIKEILSGDCATIGDAFQKAKISIGNRIISESMTLLGDPSLLIKDY